MSRPTISDIAERAGVSKGAVSFALNGRAGVSAATRTRILAIAQAMNWRPHSAARALGGARCNVAGLVLARPARTLGVEPFLAELLSGLQAQLSAHSVALQVMVVEDTEAELQVYRTWAAEHRVDGFVLVDLQVRDPRIAVLEELSMPIVVLGGPGVQGPGRSVWADDREAMLTILRHLTDLGHPRVAHVAGMANLRHTRRRIRAVSDGAGRFGLEDLGSITTDFGDVAGESATRALLTRSCRPTAIVYDNDVMALAGLGIASELGLRVPQDLSVVAFHDSVVARVVRPSITALSRDTFTLGREAAGALLDLLHGRAGPRVRKAPLPELTVRESTASPDTASPDTAGPV